MGQVAPPARRALPPLSWCKAAAHPPGARGLIRRVHDRRRVRAHAAPRACERRAAQPLLPHALALRPRPRGTPPSPPPPPFRTNWTRLVPPSVLTGHVASTAQGSDEQAEPGAAPSSSPSIPAVHERCSRARFLITSQPLPIMLPHHAPPSCSRSASPGRRTPDPAPRQARCCTSPASTHRSARRSPPTPSPQTQQLILIGDHSPPPPSY